MRYEGFAYDLMPLQIVMSSWSVITPKFPVPGFECFISQRAGDANHVFDPGIETELSENRFFGLTAFCKCQYHGVRSAGFAESFENATRTLDCRPVVR